MTHIVKLKAGARSPHEIGQVVTEAIEIEHVRECRHVKAF